MAIYKYILDCQWACLHFFFGHLAAFCYTPPFNIFMFVFSRRETPIFHTDSSCSRTRFRREVGTSSPFEDWPQISYPPPGGQISASFQKNQVSQNGRFGLVRGRNWVKIECDGTVLKLFAPPSRIFDSKTAYEGQNGPN